MFLIFFFPISNTDFKLFFSKKVEIFFKRPKMMAKIKGKASFAVIES